MEVDYEGPSPLAVAKSSAMLARRNIRSATVADGSFQARLAALKDHRAETPRDMRAAFASNPQRFEKFSLADRDLLLDWSKCAVTEKTMELLAAAAEAAGVEKRRDAMFSGEKINITENRAVLHT